MDKIEDLVSITKCMKILFVEDNQESREQFIDMLSNLCDDITSAVDGENGLELFQTKKFDLVITDINMPKMDGIEMLSHIKKIDPDIHSIVVSAHNEISYMEKARVLNVDAFIHKPLDLSEFIEAMLKVTQKVK